jgi:hypothetical protein
VFQLKLLNARARRSFASRTILTLSCRHPEKVAAFQQRLNALAKEIAKPLFLVDQFKVVMKNLKGEPIIPTDEDFAEVEAP